MKNTFSKYSFWILQLIGWGALSAFSVSVSGIATSVLAVLLVFFGLTVTGIFLTCILRFFFKKYISFDNFNGWSVLKIVIGIALAAIAFPYVSYAFGYVIGFVMKYFEIEEPRSFEKPPEGYRIASIIGYTIIIGGWTAFYFGIKLFLKLSRAQLAKIKLRDSVKQAQLNTLKGHVNPEFMFSSLNNIKGLMLEDVSESRKMLTKLSEMLRYSLTKNDVNLIPLEEELEIVEHYIGLSKIQYGDRLSYNSKAIAADTLKLPVPPMLVHNLIENATKYGIFLLKKGGEVSITSFRSEGELIIELKYQALETMHASHTSNIKKIRQRLRLLFETEFEFECVQSEGKVTVNLSMPIREIKEQETVTNL